MKPQEMKILVVGPNVWGKGDTLNEAIRAAGGGFKQYLAFVVHPDTTVTAMGDLSFPAGYTPKEIHRTEPKKRS